VNVDAAYSASKGRQAALDREIECDLVELTWRTNRIATIVGPFAVLAFLAGIMFDVEPVGLWVWFAVISGLYAFRAVVLIAWSRVKPTGEARLRWRWYFYFGTWLVPLTWGLSGPLFLHQLEPLLQAFHLAIFVGFAGGLVGTISTHKPSILTSLPAMLLPMAASFIAIGGQSYLILAGLIVVYCLYVMNVGLEHHGTIRDSLRLRFERLELIKQLQTARDDAEEANEAKSLFLANMSHELRTPLNAILGFSEMIKLRLLGDKVAKRYVEYAGLIHHSGSHLLELINDLLDVSKAEAGRIELEKETLDLGPLVNNCVRLIEPAAVKASVGLHAPAKRGAVMIYADTRKMRQIILNLLANAMKFTPPGGSVSITYDLTPEGGAALAVTDTGIGMTPDQQKRAMEPFVQVDQGYDSNVPGTGLGLPLTKKLTELHGGHFEMASAPAEGTTVSITIPPPQSGETRLPAANESP